MKIIKKLCIPLFSLVLVLGCFAVSQMDASAYTSDYACPGHRVYMYLSSCVVSAKPVYLDNGYWHPHIHTYSCPVAGCNMSYDVTMDHGGPGSCLHTHNYSTAWGAWRKISSCRLPG